MDRKRIPHILKPHKGKRWPSNFIFFDTETKTDKETRTETIERQVLHFGWCYAFRLEDNKLTREVWGRFENIEQFWKFVFKRTDKKRPLYLFAHNLPFDLTIVDFWHWTERVEFIVENFVLEDPPSFIFGTWKERKLVFIDTMNYWRHSAKKIGESIGLPKLEMPSKKASKRTWDEYCKQDVNIIAQAILRFIRYIRDNDLGQFAVSAAGVSMTSFRHKFMKHEIFIHDNRRVLRLERDGYFGGWCDCFFVGEIKGQEVYKLDVNSMYPAVMMNHFPVKLISNDVRLFNRSKLHKLIYLSSIARVLIKSKHHVYPIRYNKRLCFCTGEFETVLCGEELAYAIYNGNVKSIIEIATYELAPIFREYVQFFWKQRQHFKSIGDDVSQYFIKIFMNSLYGKFGQLGYNTKQLTPDNLAEHYKANGVCMPHAYLDPNAIADEINPEFTWFPEGLDQPLTIRRINNRTMFKTNPGEHTESFCAVSAFVTSYARMLLRQYMKIAGNRNVFYCDTDSLFTSKQGFLNLKKMGYIDSSGLGKLKQEGISHGAKFFCPKCYDYKSVRTRKGIKQLAKSIGRNRYEQLQFEGAKRILRRGGLAYVEIATIERYLTLQYNKGIIHRDGWIKPFNLPLNDPSLMPKFRSLTLFE